MGWIWPPGFGFDTGVLSHAPTVGAVANVGLYTVHICNWRGFGQGHDGEGKSEARQ